MNDDRFWSWFVWISGEFSSWRHNQHNYLFSPHLDTEEKARNWEDARVFCRQRCMDLVSINSYSEWKIVRRHLRKWDGTAVWTSGHICAEQRCLDEPELQPLIVNGWYWTGSGHRIASTNSTPSGWTTSPWSADQPDNKEEAENIGRGEKEACLAVVNHRTGLSWEDAACHHVLAWLCEDSEDLLREAGIRRPILLG